MEGDVGGGGGAQGAGHVSNAPLMVSSFFDFCGVCLTGSPILEVV